MKSDKEVKSLEDCCHRYRIIFTKEQANTPEGIFQSINGKKKIFPIGKEIELEEHEWLNFKYVNKTRQFLPINNYDPLEDEEESFEEEWADWPDRV